MNDKQTKGKINRRTGRLKRRLQRGERIDLEGELPFKGLKIY